MDINMKITEHFSWREALHSYTAEKKGIENIPDSFAVENIKYAANRLEKIRSLLGVPMNINSWFRCETLNELVGGSDTSAHKHGLAIDFVPLGKDVNEAYKEILRSGKSYDQLICYPKKNFIHIGFRYEHERRQSWVSR